MMRASNLRMAALVCVVVAAALVVPAAAGTGSFVPVEPVSADTDGGLLSSGSELLGGRPELAESERQTASCGPEFVSPRGLRAQTCTVAGEGDTWARTYWSNTTGRRLDGVLTLLLPDGRAVQARCAIDAALGSGSCETPRERTVPVPEGAEPYAAVAEIAEENAERPLLRSGSAQ
ncbi:hypothetical protein ACIP98_16255 [Streptomyces sp. NPDC088354]|uniref:hypothetical protein n=1 Tax=unclassified Streptomyces TaxID=2593676 RepID=UPI0029A3D966|nr:hypothetical protein [Streptomyces sp. MI02-7b]MDX3076441.1 hypothetical protein [Streptomyces sp. MI02-7b]